MIKVSLPRASRAPNLVPHKALISVARIQKCQALRACIVGRKTEVRQTLTTMALSALQLGGPFAQY